MAVHVLSRYVNKIDIRLKKIASTVMQTKNYFLASFVYL